MPKATRCLQVNRHDFWQVAVTFAAVLVVGIDTGIMLAVSVSVALLLYRSFVPTVVVLSATPTSAGVDASVHRTVHPAAVDGFETVRLEGEMHFVNKQVVVDRLQQLLVKLMPVERGRHGAERPDSPPRHVRPRGVVLDGSCIPHIDVTACQALVETMDSFRDAGMVLLFSGFPVSSFSTLQRYVQDKASGRIVVNYATVDEALASVCASPLATAAAVHV
jgi:SulP family sulfate permease